jgi:hypothetical protein
MASDTGQQSGPPRIAFLGQSCQSSEIGPVTLTVSHHIPQVSLVTRCLPHIPSCQAFPPQPPQPSHLLAFTL